MASGHVGRARSHQCRRQGYSIYRSQCLYYRSEQEDPLDIAISRKPLLTGHFSRRVVSLIFNFAFSCAGFHRSPVQRGASLHRLAPARRQAPHNHPCQLDTWKQGHRPSVRQQRRSREDLRRRQCRAREAILEVHNTSEWLVSRIRIRYLS